MAAPAPMRGVLSGAPRGGGAAKPLAPDTQGMTAEGIAYSKMTRAQKHAYLERSRQAFLRRPGEYSVGDGTAPAASPPSPQPRTPRSDETGMFGGLLSAWRAATGG